MLSKFLLIVPPILRKGCSFTVSFVVLPILEKEQGRYDALLGRPWLQQARVVHDWAKNTVSMKQNGRRVLVHPQTGVYAEEDTSSSENEDWGSVYPEWSEEEYEPRDGVVYLDPCTEDEQYSDSGFFQWRNKEYETPSCFHITPEPPDFLNPLG
jgi:hypothetical protein